MKQRLESKQDEVNEANAALVKDRDPVREAAAALNFWQAIEYLAPQAPPDVKLDDCVWALAHDAPDTAMPWNDPVKQFVVNKLVGPKQGFQLFSGIVEGRYLIETARKQLGAPPIDMSERPPPKPAACIALNLNAMGMVTGAVFISTVPWAMARLVQSAGIKAPINFSGFLGLHGLEQGIQEQVSDLLVKLKLLDKNKPAMEPTAAPEPVPAMGVSPAAVRPADPAASSAYEPPPLRPIAAADIRAITDLIFALSGWRPAHQEQWRIKALKPSDKDDDGPSAQENPLNSMYAEDLERLSKALDAGDIGTGLREYLRGEDSTGRIDLEHDVDALINGVHPSLQPRGCWPATFPLVTAQQFAVNTIMRNLNASEGIFSVNGPPGTGKTTMLKDIVAAVVVGRADVLAEFDHPASALKGRLDIEDYQYSAYKLDERLRGFGIVIASANNGAVENISRELPGLGAIAPGLKLDYFSVAADSLGAPENAKQRSAKQERWGLIAAVLGNKTNCRRFATRFWFEKAPPKHKKDEPPDPLRLRSVSALVRASEHGAIPWQQARTQYRQAARKVDTLIAEASEAVSASQARKTHERARIHAQGALLSNHARVVDLLAAATAASNAADTADAQACADAAQQQARGLRRTIAEAEANILKAQAVLDALAVHSDGWLSWELKELDREARHSIAPYASPELFAARRELFIAAMDLHKSFIVASWAKLERTLSAFVDVLGGSLSPAKVRDGVAHLWDAFFLLVPLVSTTFASYPRLFNGIKREQLAWLLVDEAGQATPQQAAGAIWRAKRSVIVGDPLQLEPVVSVPRELMTPLLERCQAEPQWAPPIASAQTLADRANRHGMYLGEEGNEETVWLGSPLLVHRRCLDPMFSIANTIAYENKMVYGGGEDDGPVGIGPSRWIDMRTTHSEGHWVEAQGHKAVELVEQITGGVLRHNGQFKVYVITPFRAVSLRIKALLHSRYKKASEGMAGTVHTFQGKEAEHVIFLLGGNPNSPGVIASYAGAKPNLVNVAVTRAKRRLYVIGDRNYWTGPGDVHRIFGRMAEQLEVEVI